MPPKQEILKGLEHQEVIAKVLDRSDQALKTWEVVLTDFLSPSELIEIHTVFNRLTEVHFQTWGGYTQAERQRLAIARTEIPLETTSISFVVLEIAGNFLFDPANHRDFLGSLLGTGIVREKLGDIIVLEERGAQAIVVPELAEFLQNHLTQVRSVPVKCQLIDPSELKIREPKQKEITTVEASLRLDAIASAGFGMSRSKMVDLITSGDVRVNWKEVKEAKYLVKSGDLISIRGKGRVEVGEIAITKKERYRMQLKRFI